MGPNRVSGGPAAGGHDPCQWPVGRRPTLSSPGVRADPSSRLPRQCGSAGPSWAGGDLSLAQARKLPARPRGGSSPTRWRFFADEVEIPPWRTGPFEPQSVTASSATVARWLSRTLPEVHRGDSLSSRARTAHSSRPGRDGLARSTEWSCQAFHGHKPSISTSSEKLNTILISTISPSTPTLSRD